MGNLCPGFELLSAYADGEASAPETALVARHLPTCLDCRATLAGFEGLAAKLAAVPDLACAAARPLLSAELDGELSAAEHLIASRHLAGCVDCRAVRAGWETVDATLAAMPVVYPSPTADARIRALAIRRRAPAPHFGRAFASLGVVVAMIALLFVSVLQQGGTGPLLGAGQQGTTLIASVQQIYNPGNGLLYVLEPPKASLFVRQPATLQTVATIPIGGSPEFLALNRAAKMIYVLDPAAKSYTEVDTEQNVVRQRVSIAVTGTPTSIEVNTETGKIFIATGSTPSTSVAAARPAELAIIDPSSRKLEAVKQVEVSPTQIVVDRATNRLYLLGSTAVSVLDATTYGKVDTVPGAGAVALALSGTGGAPAILSQRDGRATLSFYRGGTAVSFDGRAAGLVGLSDGGFAVLLDTTDGGLIRLVNANGSDRGAAFEFTGSAAQVSYDLSTGRFIAADGHTIAQISGGIVAAASPAASIAPSATTSVAPSIAPTASPTPAPTSSVPASAAPLVTLPAPTAAPSLFPGAVLSAVGVYRFEMPNNAPAPVAVTNGTAGRLWFAGADGTIRTVDTRTGAVGTAAVLGRAHITQMAFGGDRVFALDAPHGDLSVLDTWDLRLSRTVVPFGDTISSIDVAPDGRLWFASATFSGLLVYDPRSAQFEFLFLEKGTSPSFLTVDLAGRVWFSDARHATLSSYEPGSKLLVTYPLGADVTVTALRADQNGSIWVGTADGGIYELRRGTLVRARSVGYAVAALATAGDAGVVALFRAGPATLFGDPAGQLLVGSGAASGVAWSDGSAWLADGARAVFYIAHP